MTAEFTRRNLFKIGGLAAAGLGGAALLGACSPTGSAAAGSAETSVGNEGYGLVEAHSGQRAGRVEHFSHARSSLRTLVSYYDHLTVFYLTVIYGGYGFVLAVEYSCRS